jgi:beta-lactamase class A
MRIILFLLIYTFSFFGRQEDTLQLPLHVPYEDFKPLRELANKDLQRSLNKMIQSDFVWADLVKKKKMAVGLVDLNDPGNIKFASINGDYMMYAASLPKIAILLAAFDAIENGEIRKTKKLDEDLHNMISISDNAAATRVLDLLGYEKIESVLTDPVYDFYDEDNGGGLWVGKRYAKTGKRYPDPINGISHGATANQVCRFYYQLALGNLISYEKSEEMLEILGNVELHHKFVHSLDEIDPDAKVYRKSGTWEIWHSDSILVWGSDWRKYILVALIEDSRGEKILRNMVPKIEYLLKSKNGR